MGLFSFFKKAGPPPPPVSITAPVVQSVQKPGIHPSQLESLVNSMDLAVDNLDLHVNDDTVIVRGECDTQEIREKVILLLGNVNGIACVDDQMIVKVHAPESVFYEVKSGDNLSKISKQHYGTSNKYMVIFEANKPMLKNPDLIYPGQKLRIPPLD